MKRITLLLIILLTFSCSKSKEDIIKENISIVIKLNMNDPDSFEFVELSKLDTLTKKQSIENEIKIYSTLSKNKETKLKALKSELDAGKQLLKYDADKYKNDFENANTNYKKAQKRYLNYELKIDSFNNLLKSVNPKDIKYITTVAKIRGNNSFGAKILTQYNVRLDGNLNVIQTTQKK